MRNRNIIFVLLLLLAVGVCQAQESRGTIVGRISDSQGAVIPNASVQVTNKAMGTKTSLTTNDVGLYSASYLIPGEYKVEVEFTGFKKYVRDDVILRVGERLELNITLEVGAADQSITVTGETPLLATGSSSIGETIDGRRVWELPIGHGQPFQLAGLAPGVSFNAANATLNRPFEPTHIAGYAINGVTQNRSDITIDGVPSTANSGPNSIISSYVPPTDAVAEFKVQTATFDAQFGNTEGSVINMSIKSGTNALHGTLLYVRWFPKTTANDWFNNAAGRALPAYNYNRWGGTAGGPVYIPKIYNGKNKTFFFYVYEGIHETRPRNNCTSNCTVPTNAQWGGNFSDLLAVGGPSYQIYNPFTATLSGSTIVRQPFSGNIIPPSMITDVAKGIRKYWPTDPATPALANALGSNNQYDIGLLEPVRYYTHTIRADHNVSDRQRIWGRYSFYKRISNYNNYLNSPATGEWFQFLSKQWAIDDVYTLSPTMVLNARFGYNRFVRYSVANPASFGMDLTTLGFSSAYQSAVAAGQQTRFPGINMSGYIGTNHDDFWMPCDTISPIAIITKQAGAHSVKAGFEMRAYRENYNQYGNSGVGRFNFDATWVRNQNTGGVNPAGTPLGLSVAALLLGLPSSASVSRLSSYAEQSLTYGLFIHDDWKVSPKLTLNIGLRWEYEGPLTERYDRTVTQFDPTFVQPIQGSAQAAYALHPLALAPASAFQPQGASLAASAFTVMGGDLFASVNGQGRGAYKTSMHNFMPRFGFAYQLNQKSVIRGGYGIFYGFLGMRRFNVVQDGFTRQTDFVATNDGNLTPANFLNNPFPSGILTPVGAGQGGVTNITQNLSPFQTQPLAPYNQRWQVDIQHEFPGGIVWDIGYVGNRGTHIGLSKNIDVTPLQYMSTSLFRDQAVISQLSGNTTSPFAGLLPGTTLNGTTVAVNRLLHPYSEFGNITMANNQGYSWYHALQTSIQKRFAKGFTMMGTYTFSKFMQATEYLNQQDLMPIQTISDVDTPHRVSTSLIWELPFGKGKLIGSNANSVASRIIGGWQIEGIFVFQSSRPISFGTGNTSFYGDIHSIVNTGTRRVGSDGPWFNTAGFVCAEATCYSPSTASSRFIDSNYQLRTFPLRFDFLRWDWLKNLDASLMKKTKITEGKEFQFRLELINATNTPNFASPNTDPTSSNFGHVTATQNYARRVQYTFKFVF
jgi:hypothetical protein